MYEWFTPWRLDHSDEAPCSVMNLLAGIRICRRSSVLATPTRTLTHCSRWREVVGPQSLFRERLRHPDMYRLSNTSFEPFQIYC